MEAGFHTGFRCTGHRMTGHKAGMQGAPCLQHGPLHRSHIGHHGIPWERGDKSGVWIQQTLQRQSKDHQLTTLESLRIRTDRLHQSAFEGAIRRLLPVSHPSNTATERLKIKAKGPTDQAKPHQPDRCRQCRCASGHVLHPLPHQSHPC